MPSQPLAHACSRPRLSADSRMVMVQHIVSAESALVFLSSEALVEFLSTPLKTKGNGSFPTKFAHFSLYFEHLKSHLVR